MLHQCCANVGDDFCQNFRKKGECHGYKALIILLVCRCMRPFIVVFLDNKKLKQGHFEMGIHCVNFMPISNRCARKRATLCPLAKCYQERHLINVFGE